MFFREKEWITSTLIRLDEFLVENGFLDGKTSLQPAETDRQPTCIMNSKTGVRVPALVNPDY
jgi:hypothetical protein